MVSSPFDRLVAQAISSQYTNYFNVASLTILVLEYLQTVHLEVILIWPITWNHIKLMYFVNRYLPFPMVVALIYYNAAPPNISPSSCKLLFSIPSMGIAVCILVADVLLYLRLYALSGRTKIIKWFLIINASLVVAVALTFFGLYLAVGKFIPSPNPEVAACLGTTSGAGKYVMICYAALLYSAIVTMGLSLWYGFRVYWRSRENHLVKVLYRDGAFYFVTIAAFSIVNGIVAVSAPARYRFLLAVLQGVMHNVLAARMILQLRESGRADMGFDNRNRYTDTSGEPSHDFHATVSKRYDHESSTLNFSGEGYEAGSLRYEFSQEGSASGRGSRAWGSERSKRGSGYESRVGSRGGRYSSDRPTAGGTMSEETKLEEEGDIIEHRRVGKESEV